MKKTNIKLWAGVFLALFTVSSCDDKLDINDNPNAATTADVELVLPQAIVASASLTNQFNSYGAHFGGYMANAGGFSGFGNLLSYNLTPSDWNGLWVNSYQDPLNDLQYVINKTEGNDTYAYFNAAAKIMKVVNYQRLVDAFGNIPYSQALQGTGNLAPGYDDALEIYEDLYATLDNAIDVIDNASAPNRLRSANDPLFGSITSTERLISDQMLDWKRFANTLKLRMLIRLSSKSDPAFTAFLTAGYADLQTVNFPMVGTDPDAPKVAGGSPFLADDAIVDPGYEKNRPNPEWAQWGRTTTDALSNSSRIPTTFAVAFYSGVKISDVRRARTVFVNGTSVPNNQLGNEVGNPTIVAGQVTWASNATGLSGTGVLKGPAMGQPLMLLAEAKFLQAESRLNNSVGKPGIAVGSTFDVLYREGIVASFTYLHKDQNEALVLPAGVANMDALVTEYYTNNAGTLSAQKLTDIAAATTEAERREAIITQKYIALNMINSDEAYNEYRRTGYPASTGLSAATTIASNKSTILTRTDKLPTRIKYPSSEASYNSSNYVDVDYGADLIFWDPN